jgi:hypothetical protein
MAISLDYDVDESQITELLEKAITQQLESKFDDDNFLDKVRSVVNQQVSQNVEKLLTDLNIDDIIDHKINVAFTNKYPGIQNDTDTVQLTLMDDTVVVENEFVTKSLNVIDNAIIEKSLTVQDLIVRGRVNTDNSSWSELSNKIREETVDSVRDDLTDIITDSVLKTVKKKGVHLKDIKVGGIDLITDGVLGATITHSNLERVGTLQELTVAGTTSLNETVTVGRGKLGINTETPSMGLDIWDGEVQITLGKKKQDTGYIGLGRKGTLEIGTNNSAITIDTEGKTKINELMIGRNNISWGNELPGFSGQKGDIVFNMNPTSTSDFAWQCLGQFKWKIIK